MGVGGSRREGEEVGGWQDEVDASAEEGGDRLEVEEQDAVGQWDMGVDHRLHR